MCVLHTLVFLCGPALGRVLNILPVLLTFLFTWLYILSNASGFSKDTQKRNGHSYIKITLLASSLGLQNIWDVVKERNNLE